MFTKIFRAVSHHQAQVQQQVNKTNAPNMARYRKAVSSAVWVHLALVFCYLPNLTAEIAISLSLNQLSNFVTIIIVVRHNGECFSFFNSTLNPFLYRWKIKYTRRLMFLDTQENVKNAPLFTLSYSHELSQASQAATEI